MPPRMEGVYSVVPTPFEPGEGAIDHEALGEIVDLYAGAGVGGLTCLGVTSEASRLEEAEREAVLETVMDRAGDRVSVVVGTSAPGTDICVRRTKEAQAAGATAVMVSPPRLRSLNSDAVFGHFTRLADAVDLPIVVQDYPPVSGITMEPSLLARIAREIPTARTIKLEDPPTPRKTARILESAGETPVDVLGGLGGVFLLEELEAGASGTMTGFAFPEILVEVTRRFRQGDVEGAADVFYRHVPLMRFEFQQGIGIALRKEVLRRRGVLSSAGVRGPAPTLDRATHDSLDRLWNWLSRNQEEPWISG